MGSKRPIRFSNTFILALLALAGFGCASVKYKHTGLRNPPLLSEARDARMAQYEERAVGVGEDGEILAPSSPSGARPTFVDESGRTVELKPSRSVGSLQAASIAMVPAGAALGALVSIAGMVVGVLSGTPSPTSNGYIGVGAGVGAGLGLLGAISFDQGLPARVKGSNQRAAAHYNALLWRALDLAAIPVDHGEVLRLKLKF